MLSPEIEKKKDYVSWSDVFLMFYEFMLKHHVSTRKRLIRYSDEFDETAFFRFSCDRYYYLKDGMAYELCLYKKLMASGFTTNVYKKKLVVSRHRRKDGNCFVYRQFYIWFD